MPVDLKNKGKSIEAIQKWMGKNVHESQAFDLYYTGGELMFQRTKKVTSRGILTFFSIFPLLLL